MSLAKLGIDPDSFEWEQLAACRNYPITSPANDVFFDAYENNADDAIATDALCLSCPVMKQCARRGLEGEQGVWGGIYWLNKKPDAFRNKHKTPEVWKQIREKI